MRSYLSTPSTAAKGPPAQPVPARRDHTRGLHPATQLPSCPQDFFTQSLVNSRLSLVHLSVTLTFQRIGQRGDSYRLPAARTRLQFARCPCTKPAICAVAVNHPHHTKSHESQFKQMSSSPGTMRSYLCNLSMRRKRASQRGPHSPRDATRAAFASLPSAVMRPKLFHPISRELSSISRPSLGYR